MSKTDQLPPKDNGQSEHAARLILVIVSLAIAFFVFKALAIDYHLAYNAAGEKYRRILMSPEHAFAIAVGVLFGYPITGAVVVRFCALLRQSAYAEPPEPWGRFEQICYATIWPVTLVFSLAIYPCLALLRLLF